MSVVEKSDSPKVARKQANKAATAAAELVERRGGAKENADLQSPDPTQSREAVSQAQARIREAVTRNGQEKLTALLHHIGVDALLASFFGLKKSAAPGVDDGDRVRGEPGGKPRRPPSSGSHRSVSSAALAPEVH